VLVHLDSDLGGDPDDVCALAMLLGWRGVELAGITTTIDRGGVRAGQVAHVLELAGRSDIPLAAGAETSMSGEPAEPYLGEPFWPSDLTARPSPPGAAVELMRGSIERGATLVAIGPLTNLAALEQAHPGSLAQAPVVVMGGWLSPAADGLPTWGPEMDWNVQWDRQAAQIVADAVRTLTLVTLPATLSVWLCARELPALRASGPVGKLIAAQSEAHARAAEITELPTANRGLPPDLLNFQYDPVTCAVAVGWDGARIEQLSLRGSLEGEVFRWREDLANGRPTSIVVEAAGERFSRDWHAAVRAAQR
jgi:purine nucleosidase